MDDHTQLIRGLLSAVTALDELLHPRPAGRLLLAAALAGTGANDDAVASLASRSRCETCGRPHGRVVLHLGDGRWWDEEAKRWRDGAGKTVRRLQPPHSLIERTRTTRVVLATAPVTTTRRTTLPRTWPPYARGATSSTTRASTCAVGG
ncbi:MAG: hypothetical protein ACRYGP_01340 [Janthinobacterium lividum]